MKLSEWIVLFVASNYYFQYSFQIYAFNVDRGSSRKKYLAIKEESKHRKRNLNPKVCSRYNFKRGKWVSDSYHYQSSQGIRSCKNLNELLDHLLEHHTEIKPFHLSFYWNQASRFMDDNLENKKIIQNPEILKPLVENTLFFSKKLVHPQSLASTAHGIAKISSRTRRPIVDSKKVWEILERNIVQTAKSNDINPQCCANILWSFAKVNRRSNALFNVMEDQVLSKLDMFNPHEISGILWAYAAVRHSAPKLFNAVSRTIIEKIDKFNAQNIANIAWAYATANHPSQKLFDAISCTTIDKLHTFNAQSISNTLWAYATIEHSAPNLFEAASKTAIKKIDMFNSQDISNTLWAYATADYLSVELLNAISQTAMKKLPTFKAQALSNTVRAYAKLGHPAPMLFDAVAETAINKLHTFRPQHLSNMMWAYATLNHSSPSLFDALSETAINKLDLYNSQEIANTLWAFATAKHSAPELFDAASHTAIKKIKDFKPQHLANTAWAYATIDQTAPSLFAAISSTAIEKIHLFKSQELSNTIWAFATIGYIAPNLFDAISQATIDKLSLFNSQEIANTIWAYATAGYKVDHDLLNATLSKAVSMLRVFEKQEIINILWSIAVLDHMDNNVAASFFSEIARRHNEKVNDDGNHQKLSRKELTQLHQASLWYSDEHNNKSLLPQELREKCKLVFITNESSPSLMQKQIVEALQSSDIPIIILEEEACCDQTGYSIDVVVGQKNGSKELSIEIDGPAHFINRLPSGATSMKRRQLLRLGGRPLLSIPYWEWVDAGCNNDYMQEHFKNREKNGKDNKKKSKQLYLQQCLQKASFL